MTSEFKEQVYQELSRVSQAIAHPKRLELVDLLAQKDFSVEELSREISMSVASTSQHLQVLKAARLVSTRREGNFIYYRIADERVARLVFVVRELGFARNAEISRIISDFRHDRKILAPITLEDLKEISAREEVILLDVRSPEEFDAGHISGAISIPLSQLRERLEELPGDKTIVAYCRGPLCVMAADAVKIMRGTKRKALQMEDGFIEWRIKENEFTKN